MNLTELDEISWSIHPNILSAKRNKTDAEYINLIIRDMGNKTGKRYKTILDVPCGSGRLHPYLRKYGYRIYGVDINSRLTKHAKKLFSKYAADYQTANMKSFSLEKKFDVVLCWFTSFGYLSKRDDGLALRSFAMHLNDKGILLINILNAEWYLEKLKSGHVKDYDINEGERFLRIASTYPSMKNKQLFLIHTSRIYEKSRDTLILIRTFKQAIRLYTLQEMTKMLDNAGIKIKYVFANMSLSYKKDAKSLLVIGIRSTA
jgi:2-polyprenyl-3-methyl-5-hydroxy-6-metoxy-1,4-benzoquinol methylase